MAPNCTERSARDLAAAASMPPVSTVTVMTGRRYVSLSHGTQNEVSRPPEKARRMGSAPPREVVVMGLTSENSEKALAQPALFERSRGGDEDGVIARNGADDFRPSGGVDGDSHALRRTHRGFQHGEVRACSQARADELFERRKIVFRRR